MGTLPTIPRAAGSRTLRRLPRLVGVPALLLLTSLAPAPLRGQTAPTESEPRGQSLAFIRPGGLWLRGAYGHFNANRESQLPGQRGHHTFTLGLGAQLASAPWLALDFDIISTQRTYDTEGGAFIIVVDDETSVTSSAFTLGTRVVLPPSSPVRVYLAGGLAYIHTRFKTDASLFGIPGTAREQTDGALRPVLGAGAELVFARWGLYLDWRRFGLTGSFPDYEIDAVDLGGSVLSVGAAWRVPF